MSKKKQQLESKLGSWTDQASLTRGDVPAPEPETAHQPESVATQTAEEQPATPTRETYEVARSLMDRIVQTAEEHDMTTNEVVGYLLTWALDQVAAGAHGMPVGSA